MSKSNPAIISEVNFLLVIKSKIIILENKILGLSFLRIYVQKISILIQSETCSWLLLLSVVSNDKALRNQPLQTQTTTFLLLLTMGLPPLDFR